MQMQLQVHYKNTVQPSKTLRSSLATLHYTQLYVSGAEMLSAMTP